MVKKVAVLGPSGSFSEEAAVERYGKDIILVYGKKFDDVLDLVEMGEADIAFLPERTSVGGPVYPVLDAMLNHSLFITEKYDFEPTYCLVGKGEESDIKKVGSHPHALIAMKKYLDKNFPNAERVETPSTSFAAQLASENPTFGAIASRTAAKIYNLKVFYSVQFPRPRNGNARLKR